MVNGWWQNATHFAVPRPELWDCDFPIEQFVGKQRGFDEDVYWFDSCYSQAIQFVSLAALSG